MSQQPTNIPKLPPLELRRLPPPSTSNALMETNSARAFTSSSRTQYTLTAQSRQQLASGASGGSARILSTRDLQQITHFVGANQKLQHQHRAGRLGAIIPDTPFTRIEDPADDAVRLRLAPVRAKESALDVPLRFSTPPQFHCPSMNDPKSGTTIAARLVHLLRGVSSVPHHWEGERAGTERDVKHTNVLKDVATRIQAAKRSNLYEKEALGHYALGALLYNGGNFVKAAASFSEAIALFEQVGNGQGVALCHNLAGVCKFRVSDFKGALLHHKRQEALSGAYGRCVAQLNMGVAYSAMGEHAFALHALQGSMDSAGEAHNTILDTVAKGNAGICCMRLGDMRKAQTYLEQCLENCSVAGDKVGASVCLLLLAEVYFSANDYPHAQFYYEHAFRVGEEAKCGDIVEIARIGVGVARGNERLKASMLSVATGMGREFAAGDATLCLPASSSIVTGATSSANNDVNNNITSATQDRNSNEATATSNSGR